MIRKLSPLLLLIGLFSCQSNPYEVDVESVKLKVTYNNLDSAFRYAHNNQRRAFRNFAFHMHCKYLQNLIQHLSMACNAPTLIHLTKQLAGPLITVPIGALKHIEKLH
jgi:hypothetical protein